MAEGNAADGMLDEWIRDYVTDKDEENEIDDESKKILLQLKRQNSTLRIRYEGDSGTNLCGCCEGYRIDYYHIVVAGTVVYEVEILLTEVGMGYLSKLTITRVENLK